MSSQNPVATTWGDICRGALKDAGALGIGQIPLSEDLLDASERGMQLLHQWERKRWLIYHLVTYTVRSTGQGAGGTYTNPTLEPYTVGPSTPPGMDPPQISVGTYGFTARPNRIESAFFRQLLVGQPNGPVDYPLRLLPSFEDYNSIRLKGLTNFGLLAFYDPAWPYGHLYCWPWPLANTYALGITVREQLPAAFSLNANPLAVTLNLPFEYYRAIRTNLALEVCPKYGVLPSPVLLSQAKDARDTLRQGNVQIPLLDIPAGVSQRGGLYNIYSDQSAPAGN